ncbi:Alpha/Beta hydrolase protein [Pelagophyceae sp. CCMP2097]|nr:Alpha/Beta hydrolase protein [Pelagophyceae sp. CCMP2097]|mmetsp:Transcript_36/g.157  ORF Transcript_36/g.157 Transcript_36/m.157 type:complete len:353 (-) Transcript_36:2352-3410(-)
MQSPGGAAPNPFLAMMNAGIWDMPMVQSVVFPARRTEAKFLGAEDGPVRDGRIVVGDGERVGFRAYIPEGAAPDVVVLHFHGNAEVCGDADDMAPLFHACGAALVSVDYRGYGWSMGSPTLKQLCGDAEDVLAAVKSGAVPGVPGTARVVAWGRSIGALSACHLAAHRAADVHGLIVDSGLMSILALPMVKVLAAQLLGASAQQALGGLVDPVPTLAKLSRVGCPALVMHGAADDIVPVSQGRACFDRLAGAKELHVWPAPTGHNDVFLRQQEPWTVAVSALLFQARLFDNAFPAGTAVETHSLSTAAFNGQAATVLGPKAGAEPPRLRVLFQDATLGEKALKAENLRLQAQ